jgi:soluble lytic murein transglycosylase-like protein
MMKSIIFGLVLGLPLSAQSGIGVITLNELFEHASISHNVPSKINKAVCWQESKHNIKAVKIWDNGPPAHGVCQIKLATARFMGFKGTVKELKSPGTNIYYATKYLRYQMNRYNKWDKAIVAYNAGHFKYKTEYLLEVKFAMRKF